MNDASTRQIPTWFWVVSAFCLIWNLLGVSAYVGQVMMTEADIQALPEARRLMMENTPSWVTAAFATAVFGGALGCLLLLLKQRLALPVLIVSLIGIVAQMSFIFFISENFEVYGPGEVVMPVMVIIIGLFLVAFSKLASKRGWLS